jgi:hypothetical protein
MFGFSDFGLDWSAGRMRDQNSKIGTEVTSQFIGEFLGRSDGFLLGLVHITTWANDYRVAEIDDRVGRCHVERDQVARLDRKGRCSEASVADPMPVDLASVQQGGDIVCIEVRRGQISRSSIRKVQTIVTSAADFQVAVPIAQVPHIACRALMERDHVQTS